MHSFFDKKTVAGSHRFLTELLLELYVVSDGAFAARTVRQALQHGADLSLGGFDLGMERAGGDAQRLCLTRLLHSEFGLLILDEPSSALDPIAEYRIANDHRYGRAPALHGRGRGSNLSSLRWKNHRIRHARGADGAERQISGNVFKAGRRVLESLAEVWYNKSKFFLSREGSLPALLK